MNIQCFSTTFAAILGALIWSGFGGLPAMAAPVLEKPLYSESSKSYFELVQDLQISLEGPFWRQASELAEKRYFKGVRGRLGIINSAQTDLFIRTNLRPNFAMWFGLKFDCKIKNLVWSNGETLKRSGYSNWDPKGWNHGYRGSFCPTGVASMPAFLTSIRDTNSVARYWALQLPDKRYYQYLVEYPTGGREPTAAAIAAANNGNRPGFAKDSPAPDGKATMEIPEDADHGGRNEE